MLRHSLDCNVYAFDYQRVQQQLLFVGRDLHLVSHVEHPMHFRSDMLCTEHMFVFP